MGPAAGSRGVTGAETVRVWLLGSFRVSVGARTIQNDAWRRRKAAALMKLLALASDHRLHREQAMETLWPNLGRKAASNNLRQAVHGARKALHPVTGSRYLESEDELLVLCPGGNLWVDMEAFEEAAAAARRERSLAAYRVAIDLYAGDLLPEDRYEEWAEDRREGLRHTWISLHLGLARVYEGRGEYERGIEALRKVVAEEPTNQEAHTGLMRLYALSGRQDEALAQYGRLEMTLSSKLGTEPNASSRALREEILAGRFPPLEQSAGPPIGGSSDSTRHNLPASRTSFVGRQQEMVEIKRALSMTRLLTLTGVGGSGKTRLSSEVARDLVGAYPDGVWLVELAPLSEEELVPQAVAIALGVEERPGQRLTDTLVEALRTKGLLLVLDNCEHLVDAVAELADGLLNACARLRILATSREPLGIAGEVLWNVSPLSVPAADEVLCLGAELARYDAVRLFLDRASSRLPNFDPTRGELTTIGEVCARLGGIPLAVELAAARAGTLSAGQIYKRLKNSLGLLSGGPRSAPYRQRTMRTTLDWSYDLLPGGENELFRSLSVFAGGWTLEAAEAVCSGGSIEAEEVLELLTCLVDKSLVVASLGEAGLWEDGIRYWMLEPVRQYALEKLEDSGETENARRQHAAFFLTLCEEDAPIFRGAVEPEWLDRLEREQDNVGATLSWALGGGDPGLGLRLAGALGWFWLARGHVGEGRRWLEEALSVSDAAEPAARAAALTVLGHFCNHQDDLDRAENHLSEAAALSRNFGNLLPLSDALDALAWLETKRGDYVRAAVLYEESLAFARESGDPWALSNPLIGLGWMSADEGDFDRARQLWEEHLRVNREIGAASSVATSCYNLALVEVALGNFDRAVSHLKEGLSLGHKLGHRNMIGGCLFVLGLAETLGGEPERGYGSLKEALTIVADLKIDRDIAENLEGLAVAAGELGRHARAARLWGAAAAFRDTNDLPWSPVERMLYEPPLDAARSQTEWATWKASFSEGMTMCLEEAVKYALSEEPSAAPSLPMSRRHSIDETSDNLTRREEEVAELVARGLTNRQIALELSISGHTAATHVRRILKKLGLTSRAQIGSW